MTPLLLPLVLFLAFLGAPVFPALAQGDPPAAAVPAQAVAPSPEARGDAAALGFAALPEAEEHYRSAIELLENPKGLTPAGRQTARREFEAGLALEPDNLDARILYSRVLLRLGAEEESLKEIDGLVEKYPDDASVRRARGFLSVTEAPRFDVAEQDFLWLSGRQPGDSQIWTGLGFARFQQGKLVGAREAFHKALETDPANLEARNNLGWVEFKNNHFDESEKAFLDVVSRDAAYVGSHFGLAKLYEERGDLGKAIEEYNKLLDLTPNFVYFLDLLLLYLRHYQMAFYVILAVVGAIFVRAWIKVARRDKDREAQAGQYRK